MRKAIRAMIAVIILCCMSVGELSAETLLVNGKKVEYNLPAISLYVNDKKVEISEMPPIQLEGRVLVPTREVFQALKATVSWDNKKKQVTIHYKQNEIILGIGNKIALINGQEVTMDVPAQMVNNKVMIPIRFASESMGLVVGWNQQTRTVSIKEPIQVIEEQLNLFTENRNEHHLLIESENHPMSHVKNVTIQKSGNEVIAQIDALESISNVNIMVLLNKIVIDIKNSKSQLASTINPIDNSFIKTIRTSQFTADTTRIVLDLKSGAQVDAYIADSRKQVVLQLKKQVLEEVTLVPDFKEEKIHFKGVGTQQLDVQSKHNQLIVNLPNVYIDEAINVSYKTFSTLTHLSAKNIGGGVELTVTLKEGVKYVIREDDKGTLVQLSQSNGNSQDKPQNKPQVPSQPSVPETIKPFQYIKGSRPTILLTMPKAIDVSKIKVIDNYRNRELIFDLGANYSHILKTQTLSIQDNAVKTIQVSNPGTTKITINTQSVFSYSISQDKNTVSLNLLKPNEKYKNIVVVDIGHGGSDSGAVANGIKEKDINFKQGMALYELLNKDSEIKVYMTRETDVYPTLKFRSTLANEINADLFVSIHNNAASPNVKGAETLYFPSSTDLRGKKVAQIIQNSIVKSCNMVDRGIKARSDLHVLKETNMVAVLIETGFLTNSEEAQRMNTDAFNQVWAKNVYLAIKEALKIL